MKKGPEEHYTRKENEGRYMKKRSNVSICISLIICAMIIAFPFYYNNFYDIFFPTEEKSNLPVVTTPAASGTSYNRYVYAGSISDDIHLIIDCKTGEVIQLTRHVRNGLSVPTINTTSYSWSSKVVTFLPK